MIEGGGHLHGAFVGRRAGRPAGRVRRAGAARRAGPAGRSASRARTRSPMRRRWQLRDVTRSAPTSGSPWTHRRRPGGRPDVHRHRRGAGPGARGWPRTRAARASRSTRATVLDDAVIGASIAVNGCCLTVVELGDGWWAADAVTETLVRTSLGALARRRPGEPRTAGAAGGPARRPPRAGSRRRRRRARRARAARRTARPGCDSGSRLTSLRYVVEKGSITVDGISLTVAALHEDGFDVAVIPHTLAVTNLGAKQPGDPVNLEVDVLAKYVERLLTDGAQQSRGPDLPAPSDREEHHDVRPHRERDRGDRPRRGRDRRRRRGPRERGRPHRRGREDHARDHGLHGPPHERRHLHADDGRAARRAADPADGVEQHRVAAHRVHGVGRRPARDDHRHLRRRPGDDRPHARRPDVALGRLRAARATSSRCATARAAC